MIRLCPHIACLVITIITTGCAPLPTVKVSMVQPNKALTLHASRAEAVDFKLAVQRPFHFVGIVSAIGDPQMANPFVPCATSSRALRYMRKVAGKIGADAIIAYHTGKQPSWPNFSNRNWASAIAVKFADAPFAPEMTNQVGLVLIAPPESSVADAPIANNLAMAACYYLAEKGYFPFTRDLDKPAAIEKHEINPAPRNTASSDDVNPDFELFLRLKHREGKMLRSDNGYVEGFLVDRKSGKTVWRFPETSQQAMLLVDFQNLDRFHGYHSLLCNLFNSLPDRTTKSFFSINYGTCSPVNILFE